jgi:hypothetical protein
MPSGDLIVPLRLPYSPHCVMKVPLLENTDGKRYNDEDTKAIEIRNSIDTLYQIE